MICSRDRGSQLKRMGPTEAFQNQPCHALLLALYTVLSLGQLHSGLARQATLGSVKCLLMATGKELADTLAPCNATASRK